MSKAIRSATPIRDILVAPIILVLLIGLISVDLLKRVPLVRRGR